MSTDLKLKDWTNKDTAGTRFPPSKQPCPQCRQPALEDNWPPNYGGGSGGGGLNESYSESYGSQKYVCVPCRIAFRVSFTEKVTRRDGKEQVDRKETVSRTVPLVEMDGYLLTPHDVSREEYKEQHGEYPREAYA